MISRRHKIVNIIQTTRHQGDSRYGASAQTFNFHACHLWQFVGICLIQWQDGMVLTLTGYYKVGTNCLNLSICLEY